MAAWDDKLAIGELLQNWAIWRDAGHWERFQTVWHDDAWMMATWFQGPATEFIRVSKQGWDKGGASFIFLEAARSTSERTVQLPRRR